MEKSTKRRSANVRGFLGRGEVVSSLLGRSDEDEDEDRVKQGVSTRSTSTTLLPGFGRRKEESSSRAGRFERIHEESPPPTPTSSSLTASSQSILDDLVTTSLSLGTSSRTERGIVRLNRPQQKVVQTRGNKMKVKQPQQYGRRVDVDEESQEESPSSSSSSSSGIHSTRSLSFDDESSVTMSSAEPSSPRLAAPLAHASASVLEFIDSLEDIDESYMLSVFWNAGDSSAGTVREGAGTGGGDGNNSIAGHTRCSHASTSSTSTSMTSYSWTSTRSRHKGAYQKRARGGKNQAPINKQASWIDTMEDASVRHLGFTNSWSATRGWTKSNARAWDPTPDDASRWGSIVPLFDQGAQLELMEV